jgi:dTDP-4-dehydrorhamnose reductase
VWGGIECTINRIGNTFRDQLFYTGHYARIGDIEMIGSLGISMLRYPILWERHQREENKRIDWKYTEGRLNEIRQCGIVPIAGLLHHGSGPPFTNLLDPSFPEKFARYARMVALRFPWIKHYIPINEPLTTARFSTLYGHWYPHSMDQKDFALAMINQLKGVVLAMQSIREVTPDAIFIQNEDLTRIHSTELLRYQADFENERRWLTFDILSGRVTPSHPMWSYLLAAGLPENNLNFFIEHPCRPDLIGLNHYVTSERYLDENTAAYFDGLRGGNGIHEYVDVEAVRVGKAVGIRSLLQEAWDRYQTPMALTEVQIGCTADEQIRWLMEMWNASCACLADGIPLKAITPWSLLGAYDWDSLLTRHQMNYECGAFDVSDGHVRITELGEIIRTLATTGEFDHPMLQSKGWWQPQEAEEAIVR